MFGVGFPEFAVIFLVVLLLFGPKSLPEMMRALGQAVKLFRKGIKDLKESIELDSPHTIASSKENSSKSLDTANDFNPESPKRNWRPKGTENNSEGGE